ncbi:MAG: ester cyclase [Pseudomonadota bacterium]
MTQSPDTRRTPSEQRRVDVAKKMFDEGWGANTGWQSVWKNHATDDMIGYFHGNPEPNKGRTAFVAFQSMLFDGFPNLKTEVRSVTAEGDTVVIQSRLTGKQTGEFLGVPPSNNEVDVPDVTIFRFEQDKICEVRYFTDLLRVMQTIGAATNPV